MIQLTERAGEYVRNFLANRGHGEGIRVGVRTAGCSGLAYVLFVDPKSMVYLNGLQMDYVKEGLNEGFKFTNPNQKGECGCGESFTV